MLPIYMADTYRIIHGAKTWSTTLLKSSKLLCYLTSEQPWGLSWIWHIQCNRCTHGSDTGRCALTSNSGHRIGLSKCLIACEEYRLLCMAMGVLESSANASHKPDFETTVQENKLAMSSRRIELRSINIYSGYVFQIMLGILRMLRTTITLIHLKAYLFSQQQWKRDINFIQNITL